MVVVVVVVVVVMAAHVFMDRGNLSSELKSTISGTSSNDQHQNDWPHLMNSRRRELARVRTTAHVCCQQASKQLTSSSSHVC